MKKASKIPITKTNKKAVANITSKNQGHEKLVTSQVLDTSGGEIPDSSEHEELFENDIRYPFEKDNRIRRNNDHTGGTK